jgi:hemolysin activation/secretion protein
MSKPIIRTHSKTLRRPRPFGWALALVVIGLHWLGCPLARAAEPAVKPDPVLAAHYHVRGYVIEGKAELSTNLLYPLLAKYTGKSLPMSDIVRAAADLQFEYGRQGWPTMNIIIAPKRISHGLVTFDVFPGAVAQIIVAGNRYLVTSNTVVAATPPPTPAERAAAAEQANELAAAADDAKAKALAAKIGPKFTIHNYLVLGNTVLPPQVIGETLTNVPEAFGTNVGIAGIKAAAAALSEAYRERGYVTVAISLPPQHITNGTVKIQVTEGRLASIEVRGNHYFSSNNVMRNLPSLRTNDILNGLIFQAEVNRANASQDRQIYPVIGPGPDPGTSDLTLKVKDRFPLHAKLILNNESSPGTPDLRLNASAVYDNLWQREHALGIQYSFSPEWLKGGSDWDWYDRPLVANYSGFYRMPLGAPNSIDEVVAANPGTFGYSEATRKFILPPASGQPDLTFFASRSTIDTGVEVSGNTTFLDVPDVRSVYENKGQQDITVNNDLGFRLNTPLTAAGNFHSDLSGGLDFKTYQIDSYSTNNFHFTTYYRRADGSLILPPTVTTFSSPVATTIHPLQYLPLSVRYIASLSDPLGLNTFGLGLGGNVWYSGAHSAITNITVSTKSSGYWAIVTPSYIRTFEFFTNWVTTVKADGQWASEPLISNEQFGVGGVNSVRSYQEGEVFGDNGWHVSLEQQTPPHIVGYFHNQVPLTLRGSIFTDYADVYLIDPLGRPASTALWGAGLGGVAAIGTHFEARFLFSVPLLSVDGSGAYDPFFNFSLTAQF